MKLLIRIVIVLAVVAGFFYLFLRSAQNVRSEPYVVERQHLAPWTLAIESAPTSTSPLLVVRPPQQLGSGLFSQIFSRMMESMKGSAGAGMPIVLRDEYRIALAGRYTPVELLDAARASGLESAQFTPRCVAVRRVSEPGVTRQMYFVIFDAPEVVRFRQQLAGEIAGASGATAFDPSSLSPLLIVGASEDDFDRWLPLSADAEVDCVAPIALE